MNTFLVLALGISAAGVVLSFDQWIGPYVDAWLDRHATEDPEPSSFLDTLDRCDT